MTCLQCRNHDTRSGCALTDFIVVDDRFQAASSPDRLSSLDPQAPVGRAKR
jgi:hypothetical protein